MRVALSLLLAATALAACGGSSAAPPRAAVRTATSPTPDVMVSAGPTAAASAAPANPAASPAAAAPASMPAPMTGGQGSTAAPKASPVPAGTVVTSWNSPKYGQILVDSRGFVLYLFTPDDATGTPTCTGSCAAAWPPFMPKSGAPRAEGAVQQSKLGESGGQIEYNGHPLYFYAGDSAAHQANGQCSGQIWYVIAAGGTPVMAC